MSEHVRTCEACKHFLPCEVAEKIVEGYPAEMLIDAMPSMAVKRMRPKEYGSCSGCDSYEATMGYSDGVTIEQGLAFAKDYAPFIEVPQKTMSNLATNRTMEQIFPANVRSEYGDISWDSAIKDIALIVKLREGIAVTVPDILGCTDAEVKQRALKSYGYENFTKDAGATTEHSDGDNYLLEVGGMKLLSLQDSSTSRRYLLRVPDNIVRVREGIAWTFNMQEDDYFPAKET